MGEKQSKTPDPARVAAGLSAPMRQMLLNGHDRHGSDIVFGGSGANTRQALHSRGLIGRDGRWTSFGREVARVLRPDLVKTIDELHEMALVEDAKRFPARPKPKLDLSRVGAAAKAFGDQLRAAVAASTTPRPVTPAVAVDDLVTLATTPGAVFRVLVLEIVPARGGLVEVAKIQLVEDHSGRPAVAPGHVVFAPVSALIHVARPPQRPRIVDEIINYGPISDQPFAPESFKIHHRDFNELRDYLIRCPAEPPDVDRIVKRARYDALRAVLGGDAAAKLGVPTTVTEDGADV